MSSLHFTFNAGSMGLGVTMKLSVARERLVRDAGEAAKAASRVRGNECVSGVSVNIFLLKFRWLKRHPMIGV